MSKNVCMFVWNHFTNDARVLRECTALSESGYKVNLICIQDPTDKGLPITEERNSHFSISRVRRYPWLLELMQKAYKALIRDKFLGLVFFLAWLALVSLSPWIFLTLTIVGLIVLKSKLKVVWIRGSIILRMILQGRRKNYDIYHSNDLNTLPQGFVCSKLRFKKKKLIYDSHEVQTSRTGYGKLQEIMEMFLVNRVDSMMVENHTRAKFNEDLYGFYPHVVHNYPFKQNDKLKKQINLKKLLQLPEEEKILLYQGGIQAGRGLEKLIKASPFFNEGTLVFIGDGRIKPDLIEMVDELNLHHKVKFLPKVPVEELPSYTRNAYLGFQVLNNTNFNHYSASSNKLFEYIMAGVPVIACNFPEIEKIVEGENVGICVDSHDHQSIASGVNNMLEDKELHKRMIRNTKTAKAKYNWEKEKDKFLTIYKQIHV